MRTPFVLLVVLSLTLGLPALACAQGSDAEARALFSAGEVAYTEGRWETALEYFQHAYAISHRPMLLFNIGSSAEHLRHDQVALDAFRRYLEELPDAENRAAVASRIAILEQAVAAQHETAVHEATPDPSSTPVDEPPAPIVDEDPFVGAAPTDSSGNAPHDAPATSSDPAPWIVAAVGGAVLALGAVLVGVGYADIGTVSNARDGVSLGEISSAHDAAPILTGAGWAAIGVGAVAIAAGVAWGAASGGSSSATRATAWGDATGGGLLVWGSF